MTSRRIFAALALLWAFAAPVHAQTGSAKTETQLIEEINTRLPTTGRGQISATDLRQITLDMVSSIMPTPPVTSGNLACFSGTTGRLQNCATPVLPGSLTLNPSAGTLNAGFTVNQTGPASGSVVGPWSGNLINTTFNSTVTGSSNPFFDFGLWQTEVSAFRSNMTVGGPHLNGESFNAGLFHTRVTTATDPAGDGDFIGAVGAVYANVNASNDALHGLVGATIIDAGSSVRAMNGLFAEVDIVNGGVTAQRRAINLVSQGHGTASGPNDTAIQIAGSFSDGAFKKVVIFNTAGGTMQPIQPTGDMFWADGAMTLANVFNLSNMTVTGNILDFPNVKLSGAGVLNAGGGTIDTNTGAMVNASIPSGGAAALLSQVNGTSGFNGLHTNNSTVTSSLFAIAFEPGDTSLGFGQTRGNWSELLAAGPSNNGLLIGTLLNKPIILGTFNTERMRLQTGLSVGSATDPGVGWVSASNGMIAGGGTADANTGATVNAAVASGGVAALISQVNGTSGFNGFHTNNSTVGSSLFAIALEPSDTSLGFGQTRGNWSELLAGGPSNNGLLIGTLFNKPVIFGTNNTGRMQLLNGLSVGSTTDPGAGWFSASSGMIAGGGTADANTGALVHAATPTGGAASLISQATGGNTFSGFHTNNSALVSSLFAVVFEPTSIGTTFGITNANWAEVIASGGTVNGLLLGTLTSTPLVIGTNNVERMRVLTGLSVGTNSDPGAGLIYQNSASFLMRTKTSWNTGAAAAAGTLTNAPAAGNPTKWIPVDDNGTTRYIPAW